MGPSGGQPAAFCSLAVVEAACGCFASDDGVALWGERPACMSIHSTLKRGRGFVFLLLHTEITKTMDRGRPASIS